MMVVIYSYLSLYDLPDPNSYPPAYQQKPKWFKQLKQHWKPIGKWLYTKAKGIGNRIELIITICQNCSTGCYIQPTVLKLWFNVPRAVAMATLMLLSANTHARAAHCVGFDTNLTQIHVNNCATQSITSIKSNCVGPMKPITQKVKSFDSIQVTNMFEVAIEWTIKDNHGKHHKI